MSEILKPHSEEWFGQLAKQNPQQAAQTRQIIAMAGSSEVCSVCGDEDAKDYKLEGQSPVATLRLCKDCLGIRRNMHGEHFAPLDD